MTGPRPLVAGNWKMNGLRASIAELTALVEGVDEGAAKPGCDVMICPPATLIIQFAAETSRSPVLIGGQDCHAARSGAHTGDLSAEILADAGADAVIVGHSERRQDHGENSPQVAAKADAVIAAGMSAIVCVGETEAERDAGKTIEVVTGQLDASLPASMSPENVILAYEPVWAIGTGKTPTTDDIGAVHASIRKSLKVLLGDDAGARVRILYGGSVKPGNAVELMAIDNVDGALVGGASLKAQDLLGIINAYRQ